MVSIEEFMSMKETMEAELATIDEQLRMLTQRKSVLQIALYGHSTSSPRALVGNTADVYEFVTKNPGTTRRKVAEALGLTKIQVTNTFTRLRDKGLIRMEGYRATSTWYAVNNEIDKKEN